jgi:hypothetical protein
MARLVYFLPSDRTAQSDIDSKIDTLIEATQTSYADEMEEHGFGRKTFTYETDDNGDAVSDIKWRISLLIVMMRPTTPA